MAALLKQHWMVPTRTLCWLGKHCPGSCPQAPGSLLHQHHWPCLPSRLLPPSSALTCDAHPTRSFYSSCLLYSTFRTSDYASAQIFSFSSPPPRGQTQRAMHALNWMSFSKSKCSPVWHSKSLGDGLWPVRPCPGFSRWRNKAQREGFLWTCPGLPRPQLQIMQGEKWAFKTRSERTTPLLSTVQSGHDKPGVWDQADETQFSLHDLIWLAYLHPQVHL